MKISDKRTLIIFAKEPEAGRVKTRLKKYFSEKQLLSLYKAFLKDTLEIAKRVECEEKIIAYTSKKEPLFLKKIGRGFKFYKQKGKDLGLRMHNAFLYAKRNGAKKMLIIGSDTPALSPAVVQQAFDKLGKYDIVIEPSIDGGYYLIALKRPSMALFKGIKWSTPSVLDATLFRGKALGKKVILLGQMFDVDDYASIKRLKANLVKKSAKGLAKYTRRFLKI